jgi:type II secretion system protein I
MNKQGLIASCPGFTLVEILVSLVIFSLILLPLTAVLVAESKFGRSYEQKYTALIVAKNEIETAKKCFTRLSDEEYRVTMAGREWLVQRIVEEAVNERDTVLPFSPLAVTVRISRVKDAAVLAELRVLKETYQ